MAKKTAPQISELLKNELSNRYKIEPQDATNKQIYKASVRILNDMLKDEQLAFAKKSKQQNKKQVCYLCMEFLMGRSLKNTLYNMGLTSAFEKAYKELGVKIDSIYDEEPDAGLGNGGLGRLAACFLDGLASQSIPAYGYSILYEYGIFRQKLVDGWQTEMPDFWLSGGKVWLNECPEDAVEVKFDGWIEENWDGAYHQVEHKDAITVLAVPYDLMVAGYKTLWQKLFQRCFTLLITTLKVNHFVLNNNISLFLLQFKILFNVI